MKFSKIILGTFLFFWVSVGFAQEDPAGNGIRQAFYHSGALLSEETIMQGKREGAFKTYYENGKVQSLGQYRDDKENGTFRKYYQDGTLMLEVEYKEGRMDGMIRFYSKSGKLIRQWESSNYKPGNVKSFFDPDHPFDVSKFAGEHKFYALTVSPRDFLRNEENKKD